jgi:two-component system CheB/CheR fusion protein
MAENDDDPASHRESDAQADKPVGPPIVGIGASAGGIKALNAFFDAMPVDVGAAFVVIVHLDPNIRSELAGVLSSHTKLPVTQVTSSTALKPNAIYVIPPDRQLNITDHQVSAIPFEEPRGKRAPIDQFFRSLAAQHGDGFAVILSGAGSDGAVGVKAIKERGGIVLVQSPDEAEYSSMPRSAIMTDAVDFVLPARQLAERVAELVGTKRQVTIAEARPDEEDLLRRILAHVRVRTGHDFSLYKRSTVMRRILRRMQVSRRESLEEYFGYLRENAEEPQALLADLLISVTTFFRDAKAFEALSKHAIPDLFQRNTQGNTLRVWVAGCATGEEAYSIAILLLEEAALHDIRPEIQVFGSDLDSRALAIAREGRYPVAIEADLSEERLRRFFTRDGEYYRVKRDLRDAVLFANHSVLRDPPFSRVDLISCRNLLIYLDRELQQQVLSTLHYGLNPDGYLFLGSSESAEHPSGLFRVVDREARIYQSTGRLPDHLPSLARLSGVMAGGEAFFPNINPPPVSARVAQATHREALETLAPPSILVDEAFRALHLSENAGRYLLPSAGPLTTDVTDLVRPELRFELRAALHRAFERDERTLSGAISVRFNGHPIRVYLHVKPIHEGESEARSQRALVLFIEGEEHETLPETGDSPHPNAETVHRLRQELELAQSRLRTMREESEAANEELRAANEELQSINEEYRSTAEELETSKEELQSINEELQTVNSELKLKLETVSRANSDLQNLMAATDFATLFLDPGLRIKRFTPKLAELFNITPSDVGRPITDFTHQLDYDSLPADAQRVLDNLAPVEREIRSRANGWYLVRFRPYRTVDDKIDGVVATFIDVTERREMENALRTSEQRLRQEMRLVDVSRTPLFIWDFDSGTITQWNRGSADLYGFSREEAVGKPMATLLRPTAPGASADAMRTALEKGGIWRGQLTMARKSGKPLKVDAKRELIVADGVRYVLESSEGDSKG